jgi:serine/threonine protein kinase HipA of HipAB toxin-antitoxin module
VEHYEISAYGTARTFAEHLGHNDSVQLLQQTLDEESAADEKLTSISTDEILHNAGEESDVEENEDEESDTSRVSNGRGKRSSQKSGR